MLVLAILLIFASLLNSTECQKALLLTSSVGYYNYRQIANALEIYHWLQKLGFEDHNKLLLFPQNVGCCSKNAIQGSISFRDNDYHNLNRNLEVDYKYFSISAESVLNTIIMKYHPKTLNSKRLKLNNEPYLVYITGHGGDFYFKIREREALVAQNFQHAFKDFAKRTNSTVFLITDSCSAITPFEDIKEQNFVALGSSSKGQKSLSKGYDQALNGPKADEFTFYLSEYLQDNNPLKRKTTLKQLWEYLDYAKLRVHSKLKTQNRRNRKKLLGDFMGKKLSIQQIMPNLSVPSSYLQLLQK